MTTGEIAAKIETTFQQEHSKVLASLIVTIGDFTLAIDIVNFWQHQFEYKNDRKIKTQTKMSFLWPRIRCIDRNAKKRVSALLFTQTSQENFP